MDDTLGLVAFLGAVGAVIALAAIAWGADDGPTEDDSDDDWYFPEQPA